MFKTIHSMARVAISASLFAVVVGQIGVASAHEFKLGQIEIDHPWSRATPTGAKVAAGYLVVRNAGAADRLASIASDIAGRTEIHEMSVDSNGVMTMRPLAGGVEVPASGEVALKPGSYHIMFIDLKRQLKQGERFQAELTFEKAGKTTVEFAVDKMGGEHGGDTHGG